MAELFCHDGIQYDIGSGDGAAGTQHTEFKLIARKGEGRCTVAVRAVFRETGQNVNADLHVLFAGLSHDNALLNGIQNGLQLITDEHGHNRRRGFVGA